MPFGGPAQNTDAVAPQLAAHLLRHNHTEGSAIGGNGHIGGSNAAGERFCAGCQCGRQVPRKGVAQLSRYWSDLARVGVGVGEATLSPAAYSMIADSFTPDRLGRALSVYTLGAFAGMGLAFVIGGVAMLATPLGVWLLSITDPVGLVTTFSYTDGKVTEMTLPISH